MREYNQEEQMKQEPTKKAAHSVTSEKAESMETLRLPRSGDLAEQKSLSGQRRTSLEGPLFPVPNWDRYQFIKPLGEGGMGTVYQALDPRLNRFVALKFIRSGDPKQIRRFIQEAKAQARIDHEHVCKVYEVGDVDGQPYIAMQYIAGESVYSAGIHMSLEQRVRVIKDAAEALHAAHRLGIVHRDVKPTNIMVEHAEDGSWLARVMDFGLARDLEADQKLTETGIIVGTPAYMSPEQAKGEVNRLDRRSDIYSLGATLYELLTGQPPFEETTNFKTMTRVVNEEPQRVRKLVPNIPADLETITMKCLEKDPQRRYDSAKALADDLQRYLDGEPILAKKSSWTYRILKRARKNRALVATASIALVVVIIFSAIAIQARYTADKQARLAQQFGLEAERIEGILQRAYLLPLHDIRREQALVLVRMDKIRAWMNQVGPIGEGAGHYALGRGYLALHEYEQALTHLEMARKGGYQTSEVAYPLGQVMGELYREKLVEAERIGNRELREARKKEIEKLYLEPALRYLNEYLVSSGGAQREAVMYVEGQIAFYKKEYDVALKKARGAFERAPWFYEARELEGDVYTTLGREKWEKGDYDGAMEDYERAGEAYLRASEIGHSDPTVYAGEAERSIQVMEVERKLGRSPKEAFERALASCDRALKVTPENGEAYNRKSRSYWRWGEYQDTHGEDPRPTLENAVEMAWQAVLLNPQDVNAYNAYGNMANAYRRKGEYEMKHGLNPQPSLNLAIESVNKAIQLNPNDAFAYNTLGLTYDSKGLYEKDRGQDPQPSWNEAIKAYQEVTRINPNYAGGYNNLGAVYVNKMEYEIRRGQDPSAALGHATENYQKAIQLNPNLANAYTGLGLVYNNRGLYEMERGEDSRATFGQAIESYQKAIQLNSDSAFTYNNLSYAYQLRGRYEMEHGSDPTESLNQAGTALKRALQIDPSDSLGYANQGMVELVALLWAMRQHQSPKPFFERAGQAFEQALQLDAQNDLFYQAMAELNRREAEWRLQKREQLQGEIQKGLAMAEKALSINPQNADAVAVEGALHLLKARSERDGAARLEAARHAQVMLEKALQMNGLLQREYGSLLNEARQAADRDQGSGIRSQGSW